MARRPDDPRVTDLRRYKRAREAQTRSQRRQAASPPRGREPLLGGRPRAGLILLAVILLMLALSLGPHLLGRP